MMKTFPRGHCKAHTIITIILFLLFSETLIAQKLYVWCPKEQIPKPRQGFLEKDTIDLVIFDGRIFTEKSKIECTAENTISILGNLIINSYPSTTVNFINTSLFYKDPLKNRITVKIGISAFHAGFGADVKIGIGNIGGNFSYGIFPEGKWNAVTGYSVKIFDYRNNQEIERAKDISKIASRPNTGGYITAKNILNTTFMEANQELLFFIDETLMK